MIALRPRMRRDPRLRGLSSEHHQTLVLARWLERHVGAGEWTEAHGLELGKQFDDEIEPHFRVEEEVLLPALVAASQPVLAERTRLEHESMRRHATEARRGSVDAAAQLAHELHAHVRFEERELFFICQHLLDERVLEEVHRRSPKRDLRDSGAEDLGDEAVATERT